MLLTYAEALEAAIAAEMRRDPRVFHMGTIAPAVLGRRVRRGAGASDAHLGVGDVGDGNRSRCIRVAPRREPACDDLHLRRLRPAREPGRQDPIHVRRTGQLPDRLPDVLHRRAAVGGAALPERVRDARPRTGSEDHGAVEPGRRVWPAAGCDSRRQSRRPLRGEPVGCDVGRTSPEDYIVELGSASTCRRGDDVTIVAIGSMVGAALDAAAVLADEGVSVEVIDPRTLVPLDVATIRASVQRTGRLVVADESPPTCSMAAEIATVAAEDGPDVPRVAGPDRTRVRRAGPGPLQPAARGSCAARRDGRGGCRPGAPGRCVTPPDGPPSAEWGATALLCADSVTAFADEARGSVLVTGSHTGRLVGAWALSVGAVGLIANDAGVGKQAAGDRRAGPPR